jgi:hypothetical protein
MGCLAPVFAALAISASGESAPLVLIACIFCYYWGKEQERA